MEKLIHDIIDNYQNLKYSLLKAQTFNQDHFGFPPVYYKIMETDQVRVDAYKSAFLKYDNLKDKIVCEAGVGTLALTQHFLPYVKKAYLIENNPNLSDFIREKLDENGWADKVEFIVGDAMKIELPEPVDFLVGELMSIFCANEYQVQIFKHLRQFLKPDGKMFPDKIINLAQLCYAHFEDNHKHYPLMFTRHQPEELSQNEIINIIDLRQEEELTIDREVEFTPLLSGTINAVYIRSYVQITEGINFTGTDSLMPPTVVKLDAPAEVKAGSPVRLRAVFSYGTSLDQASFQVV